MNTRHNGQEDLKLRGVVGIRLLDKDGNPKSMFKANKAWKFVKSHFGIDLQIEGITGTWTKEALMSNAINPTSYALMAGYVSGDFTNPFTHLAIGIGTQSFPASTLNSEIVSGGGARAAATVTRTTTTETNDTVQFVHEWTFTSSFTITEEGIFDAASSGNMLAYVTFSGVPVVSGDKLEITHQIIFSS
jgi:hypothetical protein